jgi:hypothetical protein
LSSWQLLLFLMKLVWQPLTLILCFFEVVLCLFVFFFLVHLTGWMLELFWGQRTDILLLKKTTSYDGSVYWPVRKYQMKLFILSLFNDTSYSWNYVDFHDGIISEYWIVKGEEGSGFGLIWGAAVAFTKGAEEKLNEPQSG